MDNKNQKQNGFTYTYSAKQQREVKSIREKYISPTETENKMARLRKLDASVTNTAQAVALIFGVLGTLILGFGMSLIMTDFSKMLSLHRGAALCIGIIVGVLGGALASLAYPIYNVIVKVKRKKLAPEIIRLTDELMK